MRAFLQRVHEALVYWGEVEFRALRDTWRHVVAHVIVSFAIFVLATAIRCASLPTGTRCDLTDLQAGAWAVGIWLGIVLAFNLLMAPVRIHREQQVEMVAHRGRQHRELVRLGLTLHLAEGNLILHIISMAANVEGMNTEARASTLENVKEQGINSDLLEVMEKVVSATSNGAAEKLSELLNEWLEETRKHLKKIDVTYVPLFDAPSGLVPLPPDNSGPYSPFARSAHYHIQRLEQFMRDFRDA